MSNGQPRMVGLSHVAMEVDDVDVQFEKTGSDLLGVGLDLTKIDRARREILDRDWVGQRSQIVATTEATIARLRLD